MSQQTAQKIGDKFCKALIYNKIPHLRQNVNRKWGMELAMGRLRLWDASMRLSVMGTSLTGGRSCYGINALLTALRREPRPFSSLGWTRLVSKMTARRSSGSVVMLVPV